MKEASKDSIDLREMLIDAHAHFFFLKGLAASRVRLWQILSDSIVIDIPAGAPMRRTILGYVPTIDGTSVYEIEGTINTTPLPDQMPNTVRIEVNSSGIRKVNRRLFPRYSFTPPLDAEAMAAGQKRGFAVRIVNISAGGLRIESAKQFSPKSSYLFKFRIELDDETHELALRGTVLYELPSEAGFSYGIRFGGEVGKEEAPVETLDQTVDLLGLVNRLLVTES